MQIKVDTTADALYVKLKRGKVYKTITEDAFLVDLDKKGDLLGFEVLHYSKKVPVSERSSISVIGHKRLALPTS